jgi:hypothetical protein
MKYTIQTASKTTWDTFFLSGGTRKSWLQQKPKEEYAPFDSLCQARMWHKKHLDLYQKYSHIYSIVLIMG